jgi:hypothetical protein
MTYRRRVLGGGSASSQNGFGSVEKACTHHVCHVHKPPWLPEALPRAPMIECMGKSFSCLVQEHRCTHVEPI